MTRVKTILSSAFAIGIAACTTQPTATETASFSPETTIGLLQTLSSDEMEGRGIGSEGSAKARAMIIDRLETLGIGPVGESFEYPFTYGPFRPPAEGEEPAPDKDAINVIAKIPGSSESDLAMVVTAHYDHVGIIDGEIYNGTDDNASGVVATLAIAEHFAANPPAYDVLLVFFDAEEDGFGGARDFIENPPVPLETMALNLNFDMVSRGDNGLLWASGTHHWPGLVPLVDDVAATAPVTLRRGFDTGNNRDDWTLLSDHRVFFQSGIPHIYFGVEDHPDYHTPRDDFELVDQDWFLGSVETLIMVAETMDEDLDEIFAMRQAALQD